MAMMISSEAPQSGLANLMAMKGRYGDTELVHMSRPEVQGLASLGKVTINPDTGLPEAFKLGGIFKTIIPMATTAIGGFLGGPMGAAAGNALGQFAMGERDVGKLALGAMMTYGMGAMSASSGSAAAGASSSVGTAGTNAARNIALNADAVQAGSIDAVNSAFNASQGVSQIGSFTPPPLDAASSVYATTSYNPMEPNAFFNTQALAQRPSSVTSALQAPTPQTYNITEGSEGIFGFGKYKPGNNLTASDMAKRGITTIKTPDGDYISASNMGMKGTDYAKAHFSSPSTLIGGGLSAISNGVFEEEYPEYKESERIPYKPKNLKLIADPNTGKHRYIEITDEEAQQSRFAAEGGLIGLANGGSVNPYLINSDNRLDESLDGLQNLASDMNMGSTSLLKPMAPSSFTPRTLDVNTGKTAVNNSGLTLEEFGNGKHKYTRNVPSVQTVIEGSVPSAVQGVLDNPSDNADQEAEDDQEAQDAQDEANAADAAADATNDAAGQEAEADGMGDDPNMATGGLISILKKAEGGRIQPRTLNVNTGKVAVNNSGVNIEEPDDGSGQYNRGTETIIDGVPFGASSAAPSSVQDVLDEDDISDDDSGFATGGLINILKKADGGNLSIDGNDNDPDKKYESSSEYIEDMLEINTLEKLDNFDNFFRNLAIVESNNKNKPSSKKHNAAGFYQFMSNNGEDGKFTGSSLHGALNRLTKTYSRMNKKLPTRFKEIYKSKDVTKLGKEDQKELVMADFYERKGTDPILKNIADGDPESAFNLYRDIHLTSVGADQLAKRENSTRYKTVSELFKERMKPIVSDGLDDVDQDTTIKNSTGGLASMKSNGPPHIEVPTFDNTKAYATGGGIGGYFEGQVDGRGNGMSDEIPFEVEGNDPDKALLSRDEYVIPADAVAMLGNGSSNGGAERLDQFIKQLRTQSFGTQEQQQPIERQQGLSGLA